MAVKPELSVEQSQKKLLIFGLEKAFAFAQRLLLREASGSTISVAEAQAVTPVSSSVDKDKPVPDS